MIAKPNSTARMAIAMRALPAIFILSITSFFAAGQTTTPGPFVPLVNLPGTAAKLPSVRGVAVDLAGNVFFVSGGSSGPFDTGYSVLRLDAHTGALTSVDGNGTPGYSGDNGPATSAQLGGTTGVAVDRVGNLYIADTGNYRVRRVSTSGIISTVAGMGVAGYSGDGGLATSAKLLYPVGVSLTARVTCISRTALRSVWSHQPASLSPWQGMELSRIRAMEDPANQAQTGAWGLAFDDAGNLYVADPWNDVVRLLKPVAVQPSHLNRPSNEVPIGVQ
jgi:hypothetical protein